MSTNVTLVGNVTRDPEIKFSDKGMAVTKFNLAVNKKNKAGEETTSFFSVTCFGSLAENVSNCVNSGNRVIVAGNVEVQTYVKKDGTNGTSVNVIADSVGFELRFGTATFSKNAPQGGSSFSQEEAF